MTPPNDPNQLSHVQQPGYPLYVPPGYFPPSGDLSGMQFPTQPAFSQEFLQMCMQMNAPAMPGGPGPSTSAGLPGLLAPHQVPVQVPSEPFKQLNLQPSAGQNQDASDSGNDTISPTLSQENIAAPSSKHTTPEVSPNFPVTSTPHLPNPQQHFRTQPAPQNPYAMNTILSAPKLPNSSPESEQDEQENLTVRRHTLPTTMKAEKGRSRARNRAAPYNLPPSSHVPGNNLQMQMNNLAAYNPMMQLSNFAAFVDPYPFKERCTVCYDNASGYHYGVLSCEGCKGFFRRSVPVNVHKLYKCHKGDTCMLAIENGANRNARNKCKSCRFQKCLAVGMMKENVRVPTHKPFKKELSEPRDDATIIAAIESLISAFKDTMSKKTINSTAHAIELTKVFVRAVPELEHLFPNSDEEILPVIQKLLPGLMTIRYVYSRDSVPFFANGNRTLAGNVERLRSGIRSNVLNDEALAFLSGIHMLQMLNGETGEIFVAYCQGLRQQLAVTHSEESGTCDRLLTKLGILL